MILRRVHQRVPFVPLFLALVAMLVAPLAGSIAAPNTHVVATQEVVVDTGVLNVRSGPGLDHPVTMAVYRGEVYYTGGEGTPADGYTWSTLLTADEVLLGWVADQYLTTGTAGSGGDASGQFAIGSRVLTTTRLNFRTGPGTHNSVIRVLATDTVLTLTDGPVAANGYVWYEGRTSQATGAVTGWVIQGALTPAHPDMPDPGLMYSAGDVVHVATGGLRLRAEPTTAGAILGSLDAGTTLTVTGLAVGAAGYTWYPVTTTWGAEGWVAGTYLAYGEGSGGTVPDPGGGQTAIVDTPRLNIRSGAGTNHGVLGILTGGTHVTILDGPVPATGYTWYQVQTPDGATGWVIGEALAW